jgi:hypothetical protein
MNKYIKRGQTAGLVSHIFIGGLMILTGWQKIVASVPPEALVKFGLGEQARLIGAGAVLTALLLLIPRTSSLGILLASSFWGGAICVHMAHGEPYYFQAVLLFLLWSGASLRNPGTLTAFSAAVGVTRAAATQSAPACWDGSSLSEEAGQTLEKYACQWPTGISP